MLLFLFYIPRSRVFALACLVYLLLIGILVYYFIKVPFWVSNLE